MLRFFNKKQTSSDDGAFHDGAYRLHRPEDVERFSNCVKEVFPQRAHQFQCFGADWMGRQFAHDSTRNSDGEPQVALLDPVTEEIFEIPCGYREFHEEEIIKYPNETVELDQFKKWLSGGGQRPAYGECVGHKVHLRLGGKDDFANLEISDLEVYWSVSGQILAQLRDVPVGTKINRVDIDGQ